MSYFGQAFVFDSVPCEMYDLMLYDIGNQDSDIKIAGGKNIEEETVGGHWRPYFYGTTQGGKLEFDMTFGVNTRRIDEGKWLDRWEIAEITTWLIGHDKYKWLYIDQPDATMFGYRCMITSLSATQYGSVPWALSAHVVCDSPYAYMEVRRIEQTVNGTETFTIYNESSLNDFYLPVVTFARQSGTAFSITNEQDGGRGPALTDIPGAVTSITIDNEHCIIENDQMVNLYSGFNFQFLRLARGYNTLTCHGNGTVTVICEYPINVGG